VNASDHAICVLHGVKRFAATFGTHHPNEGNILAFKMVLMQNAGTFHSSSRWMH